MVKWNIIICDDDAVFLAFLKEALEKELEKIEIAGNIVSYSDGSMALEKMEKDVDLFFLDINMPNMTGMQVAARIEEYIPRTAIIFVSNYSETVFEAIRFQPFRFIRKEYLIDELPEALCSLKEKKRKENQTIVIEVLKETLELLVSNIIYIESQKHYLFIHVTDDDGKFDIVRCRGKISDYFGKLSASDFIMPRKSFLVNCAGIEEFSAKELIMKDGQHICISRERKLQVKQQYMNYVRGRISGKN